MAKVILYITTSVDGMIADVNHEVDWLVGGEDTGYEAFYASVDGLIMGKKTYDFVAAQDSWPYDDKPCIVLTHEELDDKRVIAFSGGPEETLERIKQETSGDIWLVGGADIADQFLRAGLIDEIDLFLQPVFLGSGIRLFDALGKTVQLTVLETAKLTHDLVRVRYAVKTTTL